MMKKIFKKIIVVIILWTGIFYPNFVYAYGLKTEFGKVVLDNIPLGAKYSMRKDAQFPLVVENNSDKEVELKIEVLAPQKDELQKGYEPIPSIDWIKLEKESFIIKPNEKAQTDVVINVPNEKEYSGRKFHVFILSSTIKQSFGLGIKSKLLFSVKAAGNRQE